VKRLIACVSLVAVATTAAVPSTALTTSPPPAKAAKHVAKAASKCKLAPADEYFGRLKMSIIGIRNTIKDQGLKIDVDPAKAPSTLGAIALTEDAIHDWQRKYPCDTWLPGTLYSLQRFYLKIHTQDGVRRVHATYAWLRHDYPKSRFVRVAKRDDGLATVTAAIPGPDAAPNATPPSAAPAGTNGAAAPLGQVAPTPIPGTAPQSVINAQNGNGATPAPTKAPH
jgi:hypothetical protein